MNRLITHIKYLFIILLLSMVNSVSAYTMPVGVPESTIDFEKEMPTRPNDWSNEVAGYYYVDIDNGFYISTYGSETRPRNRIPNPIPAGSYVEIAGNYNAASGGVIKLFAQGTDDEWVANESGPVWITQSKKSIGAFTGSKVLIYGDNIFITDIDFKDGSVPQISSATAGYTAENIVMRNIDVTGGGVGIEGNISGGTGSNNIVIYNSIFHDAGDVNADYDQDSHLVAVGNLCSNIWLLNNTMHTASGAGLQVHGGTGNSSYTHNIYAAGNEVYNVRQSGLWVKSGKNVIFSSNYVHDIITTPWSVSKGMGAQYEPDGLWMINNHIHGAIYGIRIASTSATEFNKKIYVIGNVIHDINALGSNVGPIGEGASSWQPAAIHFAGSEEQWVYNNLIFDAPNGVDVTSTGVTQIRNNIILDVTESQAEGQSGYHILAEAQYLNDKVFIDNNYFGSDMHVQIVNGVYNTPESLNEVDGASGNIAGANFITQDNIFALMGAVNTNGFDFTPFVDSGADVANILETEFSSTFPGSVIDLDIFGMSRIRGTSIDIGPFEQDGSEPATTTPIESVKPGKPGNIQVVPIG